MTFAATDWRFGGPDTASRLNRLRRLAWLVDGAFGLPGTRFRFGLNSVIGLLPVGGDAVLGVLSTYYSSTINAAQLAALSSTAMAGIRNST